MLYALGRHREYLISTASGAAVAIVAYLVLVSLGGIRGASLAFVLGEAVVAVVAYRMAPEAARDVWNSGLLKVAVAGTALMTAVLVAARLLRMPPLAAAIASGVLCVLFFGWQNRGRIQAEMQRGG
jgi:O-antigen/teichoic acid export membrane protein